jgi:hypothetical protein
MTPSLVPALDQGKLGSCSVNAACMALQYIIKRDGGGDFLTSRLALYYATRVYIGRERPDQDAGCDLRSMCKALSRYRMWPEQYWSYTVTRFAEEPPGFSSSLIAMTPLVQYRAVKRDVYHMQAALNNHTPIIAGIRVYESFLSTRVACTGDVDLPEPGEPCLGGRACLVCGYDSRGWICRNSFGPQWGQDGNFILPQSYLLAADLCFDMWILCDLNFQRVEKTEI